MTALHQYSRLEAAGLWRSGPDAQRREVIVGLREATIVLLDPKTEAPLAQWSLPAIVRAGGFEGFVIFAPHDDLTETLEIDDPAMIAALDKVRGALERRRKRPGRLRMALLVGLSTALVAVVVVWMPLRLYEFVAHRLPGAARSEIAAMALADITTISGSPCTNRTGVQAARDLARRLSPSAPFSIAVLPEGLTQPTSLADGSVLLPYRLLEQLDGPDTLAGIVLAQRMAAAQSDPLLAALRHAGLFATLRLMSSGALPSGTLAGYGLTLDQQKAAPPSPALLHAAFTDLQITSAPYAAFASAPDLAALPDPAPTGSTPPVLDDAAFLGLQYICDT
jgi:hypothetical protein